jgi:hypothetical protein
MELLAAVVSQVQAALPEPWILEPPVWGARASASGIRPGAVEMVKESKDRGWIPDATVLLRVGRVKVRFIVEVKLAFEPRETAKLPELARWKRLGRKADASVEMQEARGAMLVAPYLSLRARVLLMDAGWSFADLAGNVRMVSERPPLFLAMAGPNRPPKSEPRPLRSLRGTAAGRIVRTLADYCLPLAFQDVAARAKVSPALVSRLMRLLERDALVEREGRGIVRSVDWPALLRRWAEDYGFLRSNAVSRYMALRGRPALLEQLRKTALRYTITGGVAAEQMKTAAPTRVTAIYTDRIGELARELELEPVSENPTVLLAEPWDDVVFERTTERDGLCYAAPTQVVADLLTSGDRYPMVAEAVLGWMKANEHEWRR